MLGSGELIVILGIILLLFGGKKLPEFAKACQGIEEELEEEQDLDSKVDSKVSKKIDKSSSSKSSDDPH
jgi:sec-independent protein translocase protein TatA